MYWARSRVLEYLSKIQPQLPKDVQTELGPDATSVGWVFQYAWWTGPGSRDEAMMPHITAVLAGAVALWAGAAYSKGATYRQAKLTISEPPDVVNARWNKHQVAMQSGGSHEAGWAASTQQ